MVTVEGGWVLGPLFLFPTPISMGLFSHFKGPDTKNAPIWSGGLHRTEIFILQNLVDKRIMNIFDKNVLKTPRDIKRDL